MFKAPNCQQPDDTLYDWEQGCNRLGPGRWETSVELTYSDVSGKCVDGNKWKLKSFGLDDRVGCLPKVLISTGNGTLGKCAEMIINNPDFIKVKSIFCRC